MPLSGGTSGAHDDSMHQGNAKRDVAEGLAGLDVGGHVLAPGYRFTAARGAAEQITIRERTSDERAFRFIRIGANDYEARVNVGGVEKVVQHAGLKDVINGLAALDAAGALLVPGSKIYYTRDGSDDVHIYERTSNEEAYAFHRVGADDYTFFVKESNVWKQMQTESMKDVANGIAGLDAAAKVHMANLPDMVPTGVITMWHGLIANIPSGWSLCDGAGGTPDLRAKFVRGAPAATEAGAIGGADTHTLTANEMPAHVHSYMVNTTANSSCCGDPGNLGGTTGNTGSTGGGAAHNNMPAYYEILYIMKT